MYKSYCKIQYIEKIGRERKRNCEMDIRIWEFLYIRTKVYVNDLFPHAKADKCHYFRFHKFFAGFTSSVWFLRCSWADNVAGNLLTLVNNITCFFLDHFIEAVFIRPRYLNIY